MWCFEYLPNVKGENIKNNIEVENLHKVICISKILGFEFDNVSMKIVNKKCCKIITLQTIVANDHHTFRKVLTKL